MKIVLDKVTFDFGYRDTSSHSFIVFASPPLNI